MNQPLRFSSAASLVVLGSIIAGCAAPHARLGDASHLAGKADENAGLATRALAALNANNVRLAIDLAERAVARTPNAPAVRALLGNAYFAAGRFHSAEQAYRDALALDASQPQIVLKLALVEIAQGKTNEAVSVLNASRGALDASDYGLALALAGRPVQAIAILDPAARETNADATVRQNLALAHALAGDWDEARTIAAQDVPAGQLDGRIQQWMQLSKPAHAADQVAALTGVTPAVVDIGQPVELALNKGETQPTQAQAQVQAQPLAKPAPAPQGSPKVAAIAEAAPPARVPAPSVPPAPPPSRPTFATVASNAYAEAKAVLAAALPHNEPAQRPAKRRPAVARPPIRRGDSLAVVQLGAYGSPQRVLAAWNGAAHKYGVLKAYLPMSARFASPKGTFYRLSVRGFANVRGANELCTSLRREGGSCFVRNFAGDTPVQLASR